MANCVTCKARCENAGQHRVKTDCVSYISKDYPKPQTNYDRLISKTPEELARFVTREDLCALTCGEPCIPCDGACERHMLEWLKAPVEEVAERNGL